MYFNSSVKNAMMSSKMRTEKFKDSDSASNDLKIINAKDVILTTMKITGKTYFNKDYNYLLSQINEYFNKNNIEGYYIRVNEDIEHQCLLTGILFYEKRTNVIFLSNKHAFKKEFRNYVPDENLEKAIRLTLLNSNQIRYQDINKLRNIDNIRRKKK